MKLLPTATALGLGAAAAVLAACGSSSPPTVTATKAPSTTASTSVSSTTTTQTSSSRSSTTATSTTSSEKRTSSATATTSATATSTTTAPPRTTTATTRTATAPAFVGTNPTSGAAISHALAAAIAVLARSGYAPLGTSTYHPGDTLRILIGARRSTGAPAEHAFFFDQTIYLGTDARAPSAQISLLGQSDTEATLGYAIYHAGASTPSSVRRVRFALDMGQLSALDPLPSVAARR
jgi:cytoskeletal protein RodZ